MLERELDARILELLGQLTESQKVDLIRFMQAFISLNCLKGS